MPIISPTAISPHRIGKAGINWSSYWATLLSDIGYTHPMLPGLTIDKVNGVWTITSHTINDFRKTLVTPIVKYVDAVNGLDTNNGNTLATAYKTLVKLASVSFDRAYFAEGDYAQSGSSWFAVDRELIAISGNVTICRGYIANELTWTDAGGGVFTAPLTAFQQIIDNSLTDAAGDPVSLTAVANADAVAATAGTCFYDAVGDVLYVQMADSLTPNRADVSVVTSGLATGEGKIMYAEGITFYQGISCGNATETVSRILLKSCKLYHNKVGLIMGLTGNVWIWAEDCTYSKSNGDALSYKESGVYQAHGVEISCTIRDCGHTYPTTTHITNASTSHHQSRVLRINGNYSDSEGVVVHDVNQAMSLNINCFAYDSVSGDAPHKACFGTGAGIGDTSKVYLFACKTSGAGVDGVVNLIPATAHIYGRDIDEIHSVQAGTTLETF